MNYTDQIAATPASERTVEKLFEIAMRCALQADETSERFHLAIEACKEYREKLDAAEAELAQARQTIEDIATGARE